MVDTGMEGHNNLIFTFCYVHKNLYKLIPYNIFFTFLNFIIFSFLISIKIIYNGTGIMSHNNLVVKFYDVRTKFNNHIIQCSHLKYMYKIKS